MWSTRPRRSLVRQARRVVRACATCSRPARPWISPRLPDRRHRRVFFSFAGGLTCEEAAGGLRASVHRRQPGRHRRIRSHRGHRAVLFRPVWTASSSPISGGTHSLPSKDSRGVRPATTRLLHHARVHCAVRGRFAIPRSGRRGGPRNLSRGAARVSPGTSGRRAFLPGRLRWSLIDPSGVVFPQTRCDLRGRPDRVSLVNLTPDCGPSTAPPT